MSEERLIVEQQLLAGLEQRRGDVAQGDPADLLRVLEQHLSHCAPLLGTASIDSPPPRRVAVAFALAVFSQPHLAITFRPHGTPSKEALLVTNEVLELTLGISGWELDDLRDEVDRRARTVLKQQTLVNWLTDRHEHPELVELLLPNVELGEVTVHTKQGQLYIGTDAERSVPASLYLPWLASASTVRFRGRYADSRIKLGMARGIGTTDLEAIDLLERSVMVVPRDGAATWIAHDHWRLSGMGPLTALGAAACGLDWLAHRIEPADLRWRDWLESDDDGFRAAFDGLLKVRIHHVLQALRTDRIAIRSRTSALGECDLRVYDLPRHLRDVAGPLLDWTRDPGSATWLATVGMEPEQAGALLERLNTVWRERLEHWLDASETPTAMSSWLQDLGCLDRGLSALLQRQPDLRFPHRDIALLFVGHLVTEHPMPRGLMTPTADGAAPGRLLGRWFWGTWQRLLDTIDAHTTGATNPEFVIPEGLF